MYKSLYILGFLFLYSICFSQDTIKLKSGNYLAVKVLEVNSTAIKFKKIDNITGPDYIESKGNVIFIKYNTGLIDSTKTTQLFSEKVVINVSDIGKMYKVDHDYYFIDPRKKTLSRKIGEREILIIAKYKAIDKKSDDLLKLIRKTKSGTQKSRFCMVFGITVVAIGGVYCIGSLMEYPNAYNTQAEVDKTHKLGIIVGASMFSVGFGFETLAISQHRKKKKRLLETITLYNSYL